MEKGEKNLDAYHEGALVRGEGMALPQDLARKLFDEHGLLFRLESLQGSLFRDLSELFVLHRKAVELLASLSDKGRVFCKV